MAYPLITIGLGGSVLAVMAIMAVAQARHDPLMSLLTALVLAGWVALGMAALRLLDRWEPEPPHLLAAAFLWGVGVVPLAAFFGDLIAEQVPGSWGSYVFIPLLAELFKLCFLLLVLLASRRGRNELTSLTDVIVYAGTVGLGQLFATGLLDTAGSRSWSGLLRRTGELVLGAYSPAVAAAAAGIALWIGLTSRPPTRVVAPLLGLAAALCLSVLTAWAPTSIAVVAIRLAALATLIWYARGRAGEGEQVLARHLPVMVTSGWVDPVDAEWLSSLEGRRAWLRAARRAAGPVEHGRLLTLRDNVSELAYVRDLLDAQVASGRTPGPELLAQHDELVGLLLDYRRSKT
ncbi:hypothetical protein GCM10027418_05760 [Mariniluteicoccus endophyticus]